MKKIILISVLSVLCISCTNESGLELDSNSSKSKLVGNILAEKSDGCILVKVSDCAFKDGVLAEDLILAGLKSSGISQTLPIEKGDVTAERYGLDKWYTITLDEGVSPVEAAEILSAKNEVEFVQYNSLISMNDNSPSVEYSGIPVTKSPGTGSQLPFNDLLLNQQWDLINDGTIVDGAVAGADVGVKDAWRLTAGDPSIIVAVFDQGIAPDHPDLKDALWQNTAEVNGQAGVDDDGNGYIDDKYGYNFAELKGELTYAPSTGDHGTHIAGTIGATNNNDLGVSSIAGGSGSGDGVRLMSCQIFNESGHQATAEYIAKAFHYAAQEGASIAQCSYGYNEMADMSEADVKKWMGESLEYKALQYFLDPENANCDAVETNIVVFAAGNYNMPASLYPGAVKDFISVTAFCPDFLPGGYSNYGAGCDIAAPGGDIVEGDLEAPSLILSTGVAGDNFSSMTYTYKYGTSMACPHVSGVVALGMSYALKLGKTFSREDFISRLLTSTKEIDSYNRAGAKKLRVEGRNYVETDVFLKKGKMGTGAVDAWQFLMALEGTPVVVVKKGEKTSISIADYIGGTIENFDFKVSIDQASKTSLGIEGNPVLKDGMLEFTCTNSGAGKILLSSSVGEEGHIEGLDFSREISVVSRVKPASNGGWL